mmetsp:Transcript_2017/g.3234  ORF Transcript_2017/g.3234 Transcript_2017/m.3234 type:complete len:147 (+) Transcript_2017:305-745(+)
MQTPIVGTILSDFRMEIEPLSLPKKSIESNLMVLCCKGKKATRTAAERYHVVPQRRHNCSRASYYPDSTLTFVYTIIILCDDSLYDSVVDPGGTVVVRWNVLPLVLLAHPLSSYRPPDLSVWPPRRQSCRHGCSRQKHHLSSSSSS